MDLLAAHVASPQLNPPSHTDPTPTPLLPMVAKLGEESSNSLIFFILHLIFGLSSTVSEQRPFNMVLIVNKIKINK